MPDYDAWLLRELDRYWGADDADPDEDEDDTSMTKEDFLAMRYEESIKNKDDDET